MRPVGLPCASCVWNTSLGLGHGEVSCGSGGADGMALWLSSSPGEPLESCTSGLMASPFCIGSQSHVVFSESCCMVKTEAYAAVCSQVWRVKLKMRVARQRCTGERFCALLSGNPKPLELEILCVTLESRTDTWSEATQLRTWRPSVHRAGGRAGLHTKHSRDAAFVCLVCGYEVYMSVELAVFWLKG